jgi:hypothetical protein
MKGLQTFTRFCSAVIVCLSCHAVAQVKLEHDSSWQLVGRQCTIRALQLANLGAEDTPPLFLSIYAKGATGYDGVGSPGVLLARAPIGVLAANEIRNSIEVTTTARALPPGEKFTTLVVERQEGRKFVVMDYVVYTSSYTFPRRQSGGVGSDDSGALGGNVVFRGAASLTGERRTADFSIDQIQNQRETTTSGLLRLAIYATPAPYDGSATPIIVAQRPLGHLAPGDFYNRLQGRLTMRRPGRGLFYFALVVEEDQGTGFHPVAYSNAPDPRQF